MLPSTLRPQRDARVRLARRAARSPAHAGFVAADQLLAAVDDRLRRVDAILAEDAAVVLLPLVASASDAGSFQPS